MSGLLALLPGMMSVPSSPPFNASARLSSRKWLLGFSEPWHRRHEASRIGFISRAKSTWLVAGGGNLDSSMAGAESSGKHGKKEAHRQAPQSFNARLGPDGSRRRNHSAANFFRSPFNRGRKVGHWSRELRHGNRRSSRCQYERSRYD